MTAIVTAQSLMNMIDAADNTRRAAIIGRALVVVFNNQTAMEQAANVTNEDNGTGFAGMDARSGTLTAKSYIKYGALMQWQIDMWTKKNSKGIMRIAKYHRQLNEAAVMKKNSQIAA